MSDDADDPLPSVVARAADLYALGLDGWRLLSTTDETERLVLMALAERVSKLRDREREATAKLTAVETVNTLAKAIR